MHATSLWPVSFPVGNHANTSSHSRAPACQQQFTNMLGFAQADLVHFAGIWDGLARKRASSRANAFASVYTGNSTAASRAQASTTSCKCFHAKCCTWRAGNWDGTASKLASSGATSIAVVFTDNDTAARHTSPTLADGGDDDSADESDAESDGGSHGERGLIGPEALALALLRVGRRDNHVGVRI